MLPSGLSSVSSVCSDAAGIAGNLFAIGLFVSPMPTFKRIIRNKSTEQFSGLPYIYALLNCLICLWYGMPLVSPNIILLATVNSIGAFFQLIYLSIYIAFAGRAIKLKMLGLSIAVAAIFGTTVPNGIGTILGLVQLALYSYYSSAFGEDSREPLVNPHA